MITSCSDGLSCINVNIRRSSLSFQWCGRRCRGDGSRWRCYCWTYSLNTVIAVVFDLKRQLANQGIPRKWPLKRCAYACYTVLVHKLRDTCFSNIPWWILPVNFYYCSRAYSQKFVLYKWKCRSQFPTAQENWHKRCFISGMITSCSDGLSCINVNIRRSSLSFQWCGRRCRGDGSRWRCYCWTYSLNTVIAVVFDLSVQRL